MWFITVLHKKALLSFYISNNFCYTHHFYLTCLLQRSNVTLNVHSRSISAEHLIELSYCTECSIAFSGGPTIKIFRSKERYSSSRYYGFLAFHDSWHQRNLFASKVSIIGLFFFPPLWTANTAWNRFISSMQSNSIPKFGIFAVSFWQWSSGSHKMFQNYFLILLFVKMYQNILSVNLPLMEFEKGIVPKRHACCNASIWLGKAKDNQILYVTYIDIRGMQNHNRVWKAVRILLKVCTCIPRAIFVCCRWFLCLSGCLLPFAA